MRNPRPRVAVELVRGDGVAVVVVQQPAVDVLQHVNRDRLALLGQPVRFADVHQDALADQLPRRREGDSQAESVDFVRE